MAQLIGADRGRVGVGNAEPRQDVALRAVPSLRRSRVGFVVVAEQMQKAMHGQMGEMVASGLPSAAASRAVVS